VRDFSDSPVVNIAFPMQGAWVQSLVEELGSCMPHGVTKKKKKKKEMEMSWLIFIWSNRKGV